MRRTDVSNQAEPKRHAKTNGANGIALRTSARAEAAPQPNGHAHHDLIDELNHDHFVALQGGNAAIVRLEYDPILKRERHVFMSADAFRLFHNNRRVRVGEDENGKPVYKPLGSVWLTSTKRRTYQRMALVPAQDVPAGTYNLWRGWGVEPKAGSWATIRNHWLKVTCSDNRDQFDYLERWAATKVQRPGCRPKCPLSCEAKKAPARAWPWRHCCGCLVRTGYRSATRSTLPAASMRT